MTGFSLCVMTRHAADVPDKVKASFWLPRGLYRTAQSIARRRGETMTAVLIRALAVYVNADGAIEGDPP